MKALRMVRVALATLTFVAANLFFFGLAEWASILFKVQLLPAVLAFNGAAVLAVVTATLLFGRVYCSVVCPMGIFQDAVIGLSRRRAAHRKSKPRPLPPPPRGVRLAALAFSVTAIAFGFVSLGSLLDGYSLYGRMAAQLFRPVYSTVQNLVAAFLSDHGHPILFREDVFVRGAGATAVAAAGLVGVAALAWWRGRFFCNLLCPVGAVLALLSKCPFVRLVIDSTKCVECGLCARACKCGAIDFRNGKVDDTACVRCLDCLVACRKSALELRSHTFLPSPK